MFIFVHHPHFLADSRCVWWPIMFKSVSWFITTSEIVAVSELFVWYYLYISLLWHWMLKEDVRMGGASNLLWLCWKTIWLDFQNSDPKIPTFESILYWGMDMQPSQHSSNPDPVFSGFLRLHCIKSATIWVSADILHWGLLFRQCGWDMYFLRYHFLSHVTNTVHFENCTWNRFGTSYMC